MKYYNIGSNFSDAELILEKCMVSYVVHSPSSSYTRNSVATCVVNAISGLAGTLLNFIVLCVFWKSAKMRSKLTYFSIVVLSAVDLLVVTIVHSLFLLQSVSEMLGTPDCVYKILYLAALYMFSGMSASTLLVMNVERYLAIVHPIWHLTAARKRNFMITCVSFWLLISLNVACRLFLPFLSKIVVLVFTSFLCCTTLFVYVSIFVVARKKSGERAQGHGIEGRVMTKSMVTFLQELKTAKIYFLVVILSFVCYLPSGVVVLAQYPLEASEKKRSAITQLFAWTNTLISMNSTLNCLVYFWANKKLRKEASALVKFRHDTEEGT